MSVAFDRAAGFYDESRGLDPAVEELVADRVEEAIGPEGRLLEIGVGSGVLVPTLTAHSTVMKSSRTCSTCRCPCWPATGPRRPRPGCRPRPVLRGDATRLPLRDACVDAVLEVHVLHLIPAWERVLGGT